MDATRDLLLKSLAHRPFLIKPNNHELGEIFDAVIEKRSEVEAYARKLLELGAQNVLVSMAGEGAVLVCKKFYCFRPACAFSCETGKELLLKSISFIVA